MFLILELKEKTQSEIKNFQEKLEQQKKLYQTLEEKFSGTNTPDISLEELKKRLETIENKLP
jgi:predicted nuclease with TOPRIM domain